MSEEPINEELIREALKKYTGQIKEITHSLKNDFPDKFAEEMHNIYSAAENDAKLAAEEAANVAKIVRIAIEEYNNRINNTVRDFALNTNHTLGCYLPIDRKNETHINFVKDIHKILLEADNECGFHVSANVFKGVVNHLKNDFMGSHPDENTLLRILLEGVDPKNGLTRDSITRPVRLLASYELDQKQNASKALPRFEQEAIDKAVAMQFERERNQKAFKLTTK